MKFTLSWLKEHLDTEAPLAALVDRLTMIGLEVESVTDKAAALAPFTIARVISAEQHPNADRLRVCIVDTGTGDPVQVVCGAPNARTGMMSVFSAPGTFIPGKNMTLGIGTIRGVESRGMLCSPFELQISDDHEGIFDLPADAPLGARYAEWAHLDDPVIEINLTPNRPDCTGVHGIARDLAAADMGTLKDVPIAPVKGSGPCPVTVRLDFGATPPLCRGFALRLVRGVKNGPSPEWLQRRLTAIGLRPINALVDITNFITFDRGRPLHVFDAAKVRGDLVVRRARPGETLLALDGKTYALDDTMCVIADDSGVEFARRHHGRRSERLLGDDHRRADRVGAVGRDQHRPHRTQAEHQFRRPLPLRARGRSRLHDSGPGARDPHGPRPLRRDRDGNHRGGGDADPGACNRFPSRRGRAPRRPRAAGGGGRARARPPRFRYLLAPAR